MTAPALRVFEGQVRTYRHTWRGSLVTTFVNPVLFLGAMGLGLGTLVEQGGGPAGLQGASYLQFVATGLLAASAMQIAASDSSFPVMAGMKWHKTYHAALATPIRPRDLVVGHTTWTTTKLLIALTWFVVVMVAFGAATPLRGLLAVGPALLTGLAFGAPITAYAARLQNDYAIAALFRFGVVPLFLFSGTFFPVSQLPAWSQPIANASPLWHGVQLVRAVALGSPTAYHPAVHTGVLVTLVCSGLALAIRGFQRRLIT
jgi:lipooligosaccharide transport system permease protein